MHRRLHVIVGAGFTALALGWGTPGTTSAATDPWITAKTKMALVTEADVSALDVNVDTVDGIVTLHGSVESNEQKTAAAEAAQEVDGVRSVVNLLQVVPETREEAVEESDEQIEERLDEALDTPDLAGSDIEVESVNAGVVLIGGEADSFTDHLQAVLLVASTPGVQRVSSEVQAPASPTDAELPTGKEMEADSAAAEAKDALADAGAAVGGAAKDAGDTVGGAAKDAGNAVADAGDSVVDKTQELGSDAAGVARDMWITMATKTKLLADDDIPGRRINVDTRDAEVTLFGTVASEKAKQQAEEAARSVDGVAAVHNELEVKPDEQAAASD